MKVSSKPISSPSRTDKYPPPLMMRFLRSNVGSRSRGRSRSSPMFFRKKNAVPETQEPSSPKVNCIGQVRVRVRRSSKSSSERTVRRGAQDKRRGRCWWVRKALFCHRFAKCHKPRPFCNGWSKWASIFRCGCCRKVDVRDDSSKAESNRRSPYTADDDFIPYRKKENLDDGDEEEENEVRESAEAYPSFTPPKNALLLTRCRSAPYRSSSLASRFWGSPPSTSETGDAESEAEGVPEGDNSREGRNGAESTPESRINGENGEKSGSFSTISGRTSEEITTGEVKSTDGGSSIHPLLLTRCKSEPARTGERLNPEGSSWRQRRLGFAEPRLPHNSG